MKNLSYVPLSVFVGRLMKRPLTLVTMLVALVAQGGYRFPAHTLGYQIGATNINTSLRKKHDPTMDVDCSVHCEQGCQCRDCWRCTPKGSAPATWTPCQPAGWKLRYQLYLLSAGLAIFILFMLFVVYPTVLG